MNASDLKNYGVFKNGDGYRADLESAKKALETAIGKIAADFEFAHVKEASKATRSFALAFGPAIWHQVSEEVLRGYAASIVQLSNQVADLIKQKMPEGILGVQFQEQLFSIEQRARLSQAYLDGGKQGYDKELSSTPPKRTGKQQ